VLYHLYCDKVEYVEESHEDEALMLYIQFDEVIQVFNAPVQEEMNMVNVSPFQYLEDALFCNLQNE
jgi:hypothetical protein